MAAPTITLLTPSSQTARTGFSLQVDGTNFTGAAVVQYQYPGVPVRTGLPTAFVNSTRVTATVSASDFLFGAVLTITVADTGGTSGGAALTINNPSPTSTSISPTTATAGDTALTVRLNGTGFNNSTVGRFDGLSRGTTFVSTTAIDVAITTADLVAAGSHSISAFNPTPSGGTSLGISFVVNNGVPTLVSLSPSSATRGSGGTTITVTGTRFSPTSVVRWNGVNQTTTFVSSTKLSFLGSSALFSVAGAFPVTVFNPTPGGGTSGTITFTVLNPFPQLTSISPSVAAAGGAGFTLSVTGNGFLPETQASVGGVARTFSMLSATSGQITVLASDIATAGGKQVQLSNVGPGGGTSNALTLSVGNPAPVITSISPPSKTTGDAAFNLNVLGSGFVAGSVVNVDGVPRATTFVTTGAITAAISAADLATPGSRSITVVNAGGGTSNAVVLTVGNAVPAISSLSPSSRTVGNGAFILTVTGSGFVSGASVVRWNGVDRPTTFGSAGQLTVSISAADLSVADDVDVTVFNPAPAGGTSNIFTFTVGNPVPTLTSISPTLKAVGDGNFALTVTGGSFISGVSTVRFNGANRSTTFVSTNALTATILATDLTAAGSFPITVFNSTPGGGSSAPQTLFVGVTNPSPTVSSLVPNNIAAGSVEQTITVNGSNFITSSVVRWNGSDRTTHYTSASVLTVDVAASDLAVAGVFPVTVFNSLPGGGTSSASNFTVNAPGLIPTITHVQPISANAHATNTVVIAIDGANFITSVTQGKWNGSNRSTNVLSQTQILLTTNAGDIAAAGTATLTLTNPGGTSNSRSFYIVGAADNLVPVINSLVPSSKNVGDVGFTLQVNGKGFYSGSVVKINGASRTTAFVNSTRVDATILTADLAAVGNQAITVFNTTPGGGTSDPAYLAVLGTTNPRPTITAITPGSVARGSGNTALTVDGTNFLPTSVVRLNEVDQTTTYVSSTQVAITVASVDLAVPPGAIVRINPEAHRAHESSNAVRLRAFDRGALDRPSVSIVDPRVGFYSPEPGAIAVTVDGVEVQRWDETGTNVGGGVGDDTLTWLGV